MTTTHSLVSAATTANFKTQVLERSHERPVLVDFWAGWCGPCKALAPVLDAVAQAHAGSAAIVKVDVDAEPALAVEYGVRALPTLALFQDGKLVSQLVGLQSAQAIETALAAAINSSI